MKKIHIFPKKTAPIPPPFERAIWQKLFRLFRICLLYACLLPLGVTAKDEKKLYLSKINIMKGVPASIGSSIINRIKLTVIERYGDRYRIVSDSDVALMNKKAENLMKQGCDEKACMQQIADAINADEIIYGDVSMEDEKVKFSFTNILRDNVTLVMSTKSVAEVSFPESQYDHFVKEAVNKLIDPKYKINMNVAIKADDTISVKTINLGKVDGLDLSVLDFKSNDSSITNILDYLKEEIQKGDDFFTKKEYKKARENYLVVMDSIRTSLTREKRNKIKSFEDSVIDRIGSTYVMTIKEEWIEYYDNWLGQLKNANESQLREIIKGYTDTEAEMDKVPFEYQNRLVNLRKGVDDRKESVEVALVGLYETMGDTYYRENNFEEAYRSYVEGKTMTDHLREAKKKEVIQKLDKKLETTRKTGENYVRNQVRTYLDQAEYLNLQKRRGDALKSLGLARALILESRFRSPICEDWYDEMAELLKEKGFKQLKCEKEGGLWMGSRCKTVAEQKEERLAAEKVDCEKSGGEWKGTSCKWKGIQNSIGMEFNMIPAGSFDMGCSDGDSDCGSDEKPQHRVNITKPFYLGKYEVTQGQWRAVMGNNPSSFSSCGDSCPVEQVSWNDIQEFIQKLCEKERMSSCKYRLPTEAEWEYAARAGSRTRYYWGDSMDGSYAWYSENLGSQTYPVGQKKPNAWGLYDMTGNVWEWTQDWYDSGYYGKSPSNNPSGAESGGRRSLRGGSWRRNAGNSRLSIRDGSVPDYGSHYIGFRLLLLP